MPDLLILGIGFAFGAAIGYVGSLISLGNAIEGAHQDMLNARKYYDESMRTRQDIMKLYEDLAKLVDENADRIYIKLEDKYNVD